MMFFFSIILMMIFCVKISLSFQSINIISRLHNQSLNLFKSSQPKQEPEVSTDLFVQYLPANKKFNAIPGKSLIDYGKIMNAPAITTSCRKGECRKCEVMIDNKVVLGCKVKIPTQDKFPSSKVFKITIPNEPGKKGVMRKSFD